MRRQQIIDQVRAILTLWPEPNEPLPSFGVVAYIDRETMMRLLEERKTVAVNRSMLVEILSHLESASPE